MRYRPPPVPAEALASPDAEAAYLLEGGFFESPPGGLADKIRRRDRLRFKLGLDPTAPRVTWGWGVVLRALRRAQDLGHTAVLIIGDYTAQVGDPSGRSATRRRLTADEVDGYVEACLTALMELLSPERLEVRRNSEWLATLGTDGVMRLAAQATVAQMLDRDDFQKRFRAHEPISILEFLYPLLQGQDSVEVAADVELGGTDQLFNLLVGRDLQERAGQDPQVAWCAPLLVGTDGTKKMSQSLANYIGVDEAPGEIFGKAMSIPDERIEHYLRLATDLADRDVDRLLAGGDEAVALKRRLGREMVAMFHGGEAGDGAEAEFDRVFRRHEAPSEIPAAATGERYVPRVLVELGWARSASEGRRLIEGGGIRVDGRPLDDVNAELSPGEYTLQSGRRRFARVTVTG
jgi:tyrosyl-tRNA synthetase